MLSQRCEGRIRRGSLQVLRLKGGKRVRSMHHDGCLIRLISADSASQRTGLSVRALETGASDGRLPHYYIGEQVRFDPVQLDRWVRERGIPVFLQRPREES
jgi:excisionase family DNA binding protein